MGKAKIISVINYKGGVGKTVSAFNIGIGLNLYSKASVLLIDLDPQCSLSEACMKAYSNTYGIRRSLSTLEEEESINYVFKSYLNQEFIDFDLKFYLDKLIKHDFYTEGNNRLKELDFIPATLYKGEQDKIIQGLDEIEREILYRNIQQKSSLVINLSILAKFLKDYKLDQKYDYIIIDCPPSNNIITQNAIVVSDYYLIPSVMDDMSTRGISHIRQVIERTFMPTICNEYATIIKVSPESSFFDFYKKGAPKNLGVFETLKKGNSKNDEYRNKIEKDFSMTLLGTSISHYKGISDDIGKGRCSLDYYKHLVNEIIDKLNQDGRKKVYE